MTNLAHAYRSDPSTFRRVQSVVWMGGALDHPGNTSPVAEFNCFADPYAATMMLDACKRGEITLIMAPLDLTTPHTIPFSDLIDPSTGRPPTSSPAASSSSAPNGSDSLPPGPLKTFVSTMLMRVRGLHVSFGLPDAMEMHDPVAVWYALSNVERPAGQPGSEWRLRPRDFRVERIGELTRGMCVVDRRGTIGEDGHNRATEEREGERGLEVRDRDGSALVKTAHLPLVIVGTPGKEVLRKLLLDRVFGQSA